MIIVDDFNAYRQQGNYEAKERLRFTTFVSILIHVFILLVIGISYKIESNKHNSIEVTLVRDSAEDHNKTADFIAQYNQKGGGTEEHKKLQYTVNNVPIKGKDIDEVLQKMSKRSNLNRPMENPKEDISLSRVVQKVVITSSLSKDTIDLINKNRSMSFGVINPFANNTQTNNDIIKSLEARIDKEAQVATKKKKTITVSAVSAKSDIVAKYTYHWVKRIESVGNTYYPQIAKQFNLQGSLQMLVAINQNGSVDYVKVLKSSGHTRLDDAAIRIVRMAAPFGDMSAELKKEVYKLQIIRTWIFNKHSLATTSTAIENDQQ